jgi:hypothetical protein
MAILKRKVDGIRPTHPPDPDLSANCAIHNSPDIGYLLKKNNPQVIVSAP